jgi:hypothetical protein
MSSNSLQGLLKNLTREIEALWTVIGYRAHEYRYRSDEVRTEVETGAPLLSKTKRPVRGTIGVSIATQQKQKDDREITDEMLTSAMLDSTPSSEREREQDIRGRIEGYVSELSEEFARILNLKERIFDAQGFKHYEAHELARQLTEERDGRYHRITTVLFIADVLADELVSAGFDATGRSPFAGWESVTQRAAEQMFSLATREFNCYEVCIFLNAPLIDEETPLEIGKVSWESSEVQIYIGYASDELLEKFNASRRDAQLSRINTVISFRYKVRVEAPVDSYLQVYVLGARVAEQVVDCLRLIRNEDIGVLALEVFPTESFTPLIRKTYEQQYQPELALFLPKRFSFQVESVAPLNDGELRELRSLWSSYSDVDLVKGLRVALRRFRSSCERYDRFDPERLLDMAFSFEAIFLNDGENKELSYRLSSRVARFLGNTVERRLEIFDTVKMLYNLRSKIAHGETLDKMRRGDAEKVNQVLDEAPRILTEALKAMVLGKGARLLNTTEALSNWWKKIELG